jgi:hypothetical protein
MYRDANDYYKSCDACQRIRGLVTQSFAKLVTSLPKKPFVKWGFDFVGQIKPVIIYKKQIHFCRHKLCYHVGGSKSNEN